MAARDSLISLVKGMYSARPRWALVRLLGFGPLLAVTMAAGPCGKEPLGSVDGGSACTYQGKTYRAGSKFPAVDGCNSCACDSDGVVSCSQQGCRDGGGDGLEGGGDLVGRCFDATGREIACPDGGTSDVTPTCYDVEGLLSPCDPMPMCFDSTGANIPCTKDGGVEVCSYEGKSYPAGASFPASDNCNRCTCGADGLVTCSALGCVDAGADAPTSCTYQGKVYEVGATFPAADGCNTCSCWQGGIVPCTAIACQDAGAKTGVCSPSNDWTCNEDPTINSLRGSCQPDGSCKCATGAASPYTGKCVASDNSAGTGCELGKTFPVGATFTCADSCSTCTCAGPGKIVADTSKCTDAGSPSCGLDGVYTYGDVGGLAAYQDQVALAPSPVSPRTYATYTYTRTYVDGSKGVSCAPDLPSCGDTTAIDLSDIMADILDPVVQKYLLTDPAKAPFLGFDTRPIDGTAFSFGRGDGRGFLVGQACGTSSAASSCVPIPAPIDKLVKDLRALNDQQLRSPGCAALR